MRVRVATEADIEPMHRIRVAVRENRLADPAYITFDDYRGMLLARGRGWVAEIDGAIAGFAIADLSRANVWALFVDPGFEGRGAGRRLHDTMMEWFFANGTARVGLGTDPGTRAERLYRAAGWALAGTQPNGEATYEMTREAWIARAGRAA